MRYPPSLLDEIRARLPVSQVVSRRVALKRQGREYIGLSPFKAEKSPSFTVNDQKGFYHCFSSGAHGDIFRFVMETEGLSFPEAVERLAAEAGVRLPAPGPDVERKEAEHGRLQQACEAACRFFEASLAAASGREARAYLDRRGVSPELRARFRMGLAPAGSAGLREHLTKAGFGLEELVRAGLLVAGEDGRTPYDRFRNRLIIPITDLRDRVIAFGGRALAADAKPKYLNSPETPLFHKGAILFNAAKARQQAHDSRQVVVVEGYMDVVALAGAGFENAVAPLGTALTEAQLQLLWKLADEPTLCFDGDAAGQKAAFRALDVALPHLAPGRSLKFAFLPDGLDPDDLVRQRGAEALAQALRATRPLLDVLWMKEDQVDGILTPEHRALFEQRLRKQAGLIADRSVREQYLREIGEALWQRNREAMRQLRGGGGKGRDAAVAQARRNNARLDWKARERLRQARPSRRGDGRGESAPLASDSLLSHLSTRAGGEATAVAREALILKAFLNHPWLLDDMLEELAALAIANPVLARLRDDLLTAHAEGIPLDRAAMTTHVEGSGRSDALGLISHVITHRGDRFADPDASAADVRLGLRDALDRQERLRLAADLRAAEQALSEEGTEEAFAQLRDIQQRLHAADSRMAGSESD